MKKITVLILLLLTAGTKLFALNADSLFNAANSQYKNGQFEKAAHGYQSLIDQGYASGGTYFNLANAWYKLGKMGLARLNYERAKRFIDGDDALKQNLQMVRLRLVDQIQQPPVFFLTRWWNGLLFLFSLSVWLNIAVALFIVLLIAAAFFLSTRRRGREKGRMLFYLLLIVWLGTGIIATDRYYLFETEQSGIILTPMVTVYSGPGKDATELFVLHEGSKVQIERNSGDWYEIRLADGKRGWLKKSAFEII